MGLKKATDLAREFAELADRMEKSDDHQEQDDIADRQCSVADLLAVELLAWSYDEQEPREIFHKMFAAWDE